MGEILGTPTRDMSQLSIVFVFGGPGSGKGTQCARLSRDLNYLHLCMGDLLRKEVEEKHQYLQDVIDSGDLVDDTVALDVLDAAINTELNRAMTSRIIIDGFPRNLSQTQAFREKFGRDCDLALYLDVAESTMRERIAQRRASGEGRADDSEAVGEQRIKHFVEQTMPVVDMYESLGKLYRINGEGDVDAVAKQVFALLDGKLSTGTSELQSPPPTAYQPDSEAGDFGSQAQLPPMRSRQRSTESKLSAEAKPSTETSQWSTTQPATADMSAREWWQEMADLANADESTQDEDTARVTEDLATLKLAGRDAEVPGASSVLMDLPAQTEVGATPEATNAFSAGVLETDLPAPNEANPAETEQGARHAAGDPSHHREEEKEEEEEDEEQGRLEGKQQQQQQQQQQPAGLKEMVGLVGDKLAQVGQKLAEGAGVTMPHQAQVQRDNADIGAA